MPESKTKRIVELQKQEADSGWEEYQDNVYRCPVYVLREEDGRRSAIAANLPGVASYGATEEEALQHVEEALAAAIATYTEGGGRVPWLATPRAAPPDSETRWVIVHA
jgi:predicted RNase H-like HicB family nuclease